MFVIQGWNKFFFSQWKGEVKVGAPEFTAKERVNLEHELSDVLIYLLDLSQVCHIDLAAATLRQLEQNANKFPISNGVNGHGDSKSVTGISTEIPKHDT